MLIGFIQQFGTWQVRSWQFGIQQSGMDSFIDFCIFFPLIYSCVGKHHFSGRFGVVNLQVIGEN